MLDSQRSIGLSESFEYERSGNNETMAELSIPIPSITPLRLKVRQDPEASFVKASRA